MMVPRERRNQQRKENEYARLSAERQRLAASIRAKDRVRVALSKGMTNWAIHRHRKLRRIEAQLHLNDAPGR